MFCDKCGKNQATTHIRTVVNGVVHERNLCGYCAAQENHAVLAHNSLGEMLASMFGDVLTAETPAAQKSCPVCGASFSDIAESGKVGCAECYHTFYEELLPYLRRVHGSTQHAGIIPNKAPLSVTPAADSVEGMRRQLNELIRSEKFEEAAVLRDKIKKAEEGLA